MSTPRVLVVKWNDYLETLRAIRETVFIQEQNVPVELEWDEYDETSWHALVYNAADEPVGTARLLLDGHIGRMAVLKEWRRKGFGSALLIRLLEEARKHGLSSVKLNAQVSAAQFYQKFGFVKIGETFVEAGIPHIAMVMKL